MQPKKRRSHDEDDLQAWCVEYAAWAHPKLLIFAVPNGGWRKPQEAARLKRMGVLAGVSDLIISTNQEVVFCEMKTPTGPQSDEQKTFQQRVEAQGKKYIIVRTQDEFMGLCKRLDYGINTLFK